MAILDAAVRGAVPGYPISVVLKLGRTTPHYRGAWMLSRQECASCGGINKKGSSDASKAILLF